MFRWAIKAAPSSRHATRGVAAPVDDSLSAFLQQLTGSRGAAGYDGRDERWEAGQADSPAAARDSHCVQSKL